MAAIRVTRRIAASPDAVWHALSDIADHVTWMADAEAIRFTGDRRAGVGATFECDTRVGPLRTTDRMEVTEWVPGEVVGVRHTGLVAGTGRFTVAPARPPAAGTGAGRPVSDLVWEEDLRFPWWLGGPLAGRAAAPVLRAVWRGNLRRFAERVEAGGPAAAPGPAQTAPRPPAGSRRTARRRRGG